MLQPSLSLQIEFHTSHLFQMLLSVAARQFCLPLTRCLHKVFAPHGTGQAAWFSNTIAAGIGLQGAPGGDVLNKLCLHSLYFCLVHFLLSLFWICNKLIYNTPGVSFQLVCTRYTLHSPQLLFSLLVSPSLSFSLSHSLAVPLMHYCMAFPLLVRIDGVPGSLWEEKPSVSVSPSRMNNGCEWIRWLNCFIWVLCSNGQP